MNLLVTGGAGFIGSNLCDKLLAAGNKVIALDNFNDYYDPALKERNVKPNLTNPNYKLIRGDIEDTQTVNSVFEENPIDAVVHIAARAGVRPSIDHPLAYMKTNVGGTTNILMAMAAHKVKKLVFASSSSVYGNCTAERFHEELSVSRPISPYAASKSACEQICYTYTHLYDIQTVCLRFFTVYGPRQRPDLAISKFADRIESGKPIDMYGDGSTMRDYTYVDDIVNGVCAALEYDKTKYEIINLGCGSPIKLSEMISSIEVALERSAIINIMPMQPGDVDKTICDNTKARRLLGFKPATSFQDGIRKFIEWRKNESRALA